MEYAGVFRAAQQLLAVLREKGGGQDVHLEAVGVALGGDVAGGSGFSGGGVQDQCVQLAELFFCELGRRDYLVLIADIALEGNEVLAQLLCTLKVATYADNVGALRYELLCRGEAHAGSGAGDHCLVAF